MTTTNKLTRAEIADSLEAIRAANGGLLRPADVVDAAADEDHPLHDCFTWDDDAAAHQYRLWQARQMIRVVVTVVSNGGGHTVRAYVSLHDDRGGEEGGYRAIVDVLSDAELRQTMLDEAMSELRVFQKKYKALKELVPIFKAIRNVSRRKGRRG